MFRVWCALGVACGALLTAPVGVALAAEAQNIIVAIINDEAVTRLDLETVLFDQGGSDVAQLPLAERVNIGLQQLIEERLILQAARQAKLTADEAQVEARLEETRRRFASEEEFDQALEVEGLTRAMLRKRYRDQLLMQRAMDQEVRAKIVVAPNEMARYYSDHPEEMRSSPKVRARHILVRTTAERPSAAALARAEALRRQIAKGDAFSAVARESSDAPEAAQGGELGWVAPGDLRPELDEVLFRIEPDQLSEIITSPLGYHLVLVEEREAVQEWAFEDVAPSIREKLLRQKFEQKLAQWLADLRAKSYIVIRPLESPSAAPAS